VAEIQLGLALLPNGKRRRLLAEMAEQMFLEDFSGRCLPFDFEAAKDYALIVADRNRLGSPVSVEDAQIAAIARTGGLTLATRNIKDFADIQGLETVNPWTDPK
jgi:predicted nucleic acid-binding protein